MTHGGGGDRPRRRDINDELIEDAASKLGRDVEADRSKVAGVVEVVRSSCGEREEVVERELSCCGKVLAKELLSSEKKRSPLTDSNRRPPPLPWQPVQTDFACFCGFRGSSICR